MNRERYNDVVRTLFACDPQAITNIFHEFLLATQAEKTLPPSPLMTQNYETAQANPEIHAPPGNLKKVLNLLTTGPSVVWWVLPKGRDAKAIFADVVSGRLSAEAFAHYAAEIRHLFHNRAKTMDSAVDARVSFTTNIGHTPHGIPLPAWKEVFFNPMTNEKVIDRLIYSIEELV